jgi:CPA2 family monovalent cation:H+ antiporter-2
MHGADEFLKAITVVLCIAAATTIACQRLKLPVVLGYIVAGLIVGPHVPIPIFVSRRPIETVSEVGVILLMFSLGLEFNLRRLVRVAPTAGLTALIQSSAMVWIGFVVGRAFGWTTRESIFAGAMVAVSSTTIIAKAFEEQRIAGKLRDLVVGILIAEDLIAVIMMAVLAALPAGGEAISAGTIARSGGRLAAFLAAILFFGMLVVPRGVRFIRRLDRPETTLIASLGICFAVALLAKYFGYSVALGAFISGSLIAESGEERQIGRLIFPVRDLFAATFFVSVGMLIDPASIVHHWGEVAAFTVVVVVGKLVSASVGAFLTGSGTRRSIQAGMSLTQIGEFSFIIVALGVSTGAVREFLYPVAVGVSAVTTLTTPWLIRASSRVARAVDHALPTPIQTFATFYARWLEDLRSTPPRRTAVSRALRRVRLLALDAALLTAVVVAAIVSRERLAHLASSRLGLPAGMAWPLVLVAFAALALPFVVGIVRVARRLGMSLARVVLPAVGEGSVDLAAAPRRALVVAFQLALVLLVGLPLLALVQPFVAGWAAALCLGVWLVFLGVVFWRSATNLEGHVKAGAQIIVEALVTQADKGKPGGDEEALARVEQLMPGLGEPVPVRLQEDSTAVGRTLGQIHLRGRTGASVLVIARGDAGVIAPRAEEVLRAGDVLALTGTRDAVAAAVDVLAGRGQSMGTLK